VHAIYQRAGRYETTQQRLGLTLIFEFAATGRRGRRAKTAGRAVILYLPGSAPWLGDFKHELLAFPAGRNDDQVDALVYALTRLREASDYDRNYLT
jgi:phage terminase large subunit-like protein